MKHYQVIEIDKAGEYYRVGGFDTWREADLCFDGWIEDHTHNDTLAAIVLIDTILWSIERTWEHN
jgi:hypothetical protein